jgi:hypothetical protein
LREFVCHECKPHPGFTMQSDPEHIKLWRALLADRQREDARVTADLKAQMAELEERLRNGPRTIGLDQIQAALEEAQRAFRSRENTWQALCEVRLLHREGADGGAVAARASTAARKHRSLTGTRHSSSGKTSSMTGSGAA